MAQRYTMCILICLLQNRITTLAYIISRDFALICQNKYIISLDFALICQNKLMPCIALMCFRTLQTVQSILTLSKFTSEDHRLFRPVAILLWSLILITVLLILLWEYNHTLKTIYWFSIAARKFDIHKAELMYRKVGHTLSYGIFPHKSTSRSRLLLFWQPIHGPIPSME